MTNATGAVTPYEEIFARIGLRRQEVPAGFHLDCVGSITRYDHMLPTPYVRRMRLETTEPRKTTAQVYPANNPHRYEMGAVLDAALSARGRFTMVELGAGIAPWCVIAACGLRLLDPKPCLLVGVEAEATRFRWMRQHLIDNGLDPDEHIQIRAAILPSDDPQPFVLFPRGSPDFGGHHVITDLTQENATRGVTQSPHFDPQADTYTLERVDVVTLEDVLARIPDPVVDLVHMDIQGLEERVLRAAIEPVTRRVRQLAIGTHGTAIDDALRVLMPQHGWELRFSLASRALNQVGDATVDLLKDDGFQHWINPAL
jgi:FkbM family methyltransferase